MLLTDRELEALMTDLESDRVERKSNLTDKSKIRQAICAFANDLPDHRQPGVVFIGANDDGSCSNLSITDELLLTLADMRSDGNTLPFPMMTVQKRRLFGCEVAVVQVQPSPNPPVRFDGRVWIRVGPRRAIATADEERRLSEKRRAHDLSYDQRAVEGATLEDLDLDRFRHEYLPNAVAREVLLENHRSVEQQLQALRLVSNDQVPTTVGVLLFGRDPLRWIPGAYIQFLRVDGTDLTDPIRDEKKLSGPLPEMIRQLEDVLKANISTAVDVTSGTTEARFPDYPFIALQQLCRNALLHRTYEVTTAPTRVYWFADRIEVFSPGGLYGTVTPENFGTGVTDYRNPALAEAMKILGFVQRFGMGIPLARKEMAKNGNPTLEYQFEASGVLVTIRRRTA